MELRDEIAIIDARINDLLQRVDTGESRAVWRDVQAAMATFERERGRGHVEAMQRAIHELQGILTQGADDYKAWAEVGELIEQRRRLKARQNYLVYRRFW